MSEAFILSSVGGGVFETGLQAVLTARGLSVRAEHAVPVERYWRAKSGWARYLLRAQMYGFYPMRVALHCLRDRHVTYLATTNPFFLPALVGTVSRLRGHRVVQWLYDLFPDALVAGGSLRQESLQARLLSRLTRASLRRCGATVFLGRRLADHVTRMYGPARRSAIIPIGSDARLFSDMPAALSRAAPGPESSTLEILYSGNFGRMHDSATLARALSQGGGGSGVDVLPLIRFLFQCNGPGIPSLRRECPHLEGSFASHATRSAPGFRWELRFGGTLDTGPWASLLRSVPIALVTMIPGAEKVVMPSKTYSALVAGQAILAICPLESDLADTILENDCGWVVVPEGLPLPEVGESNQDRVFHGAKGLLDLLSRLAHEPGWIHQKRMNAVQAGHGRYSMEAVGSQWFDLLASL